MHLLSRSWAMDAACCMHAIYMCQDVCCNGEHIACHAAREACLLARLQVQEAS